MKTKANNKFKILLAAFSLISLGFYFSPDFADATVIDNIPNSQTGNFDFYVLSLSWTPSFCSSPNIEFPRKGTTQCINPKDELVVHGLWPQYEHGYPTSCNSRMTGPSEAIISRMQTIMPSRRLVQIEWERHGTCSGLSAEDYFYKVSDARSRVNIPFWIFTRQQNLSVNYIERSFVRNNYGMSANGIAIITRNNALSEVRICMTKELQFRDCDEVNARAARPLGQIRIPH